jgi:Lar family restriction alleviation protein
MSEKLKRCPFCGSTKLKLEKKSHGRARDGRPLYTASIRCNCCHARGGTILNSTLPYAIKEDVEAEAIDRWNRRAEK